MWSLATSIQNELFIAKVNTRTVLRNWEKYVGVVTKSYLMGLFDISTQRIRTKQGIRLAYPVGREIDDIVDGDIPLPNWFTDVPQLLAQVKADLLGSLAPQTSLGKYARVVAGDLEKLGCATIRTDLADFLDGMQSEYVRRRDKQLLSYDALCTLHDQSFRGSQQAYLVALWSRFHAADIAELPQILWWIYGLKDLKDDLSKGICNIPAEVLAQIPNAVDAQRNIDLTALLASPVFMQRVAHVVAQQKDNLACLQEKLQHMDLGVNKMCGGLLPEIEAFINTFSIGWYREYLRSS